MNECCTEPFDRLAEVSARHQVRVHVHAVGIERHRAPGRFCLIDGYEHEIDIGLRPDGVVRQAAAEDRRQYAAVLLYLGDERVERRGEERFGIGGHAAAV